MDGERFQLRWNDFHNNISNNFRDLRYKTEFQDVTLFVDKQHTVSAHKVILSSSSPYFHELLSNLPAGASPHPVIIMPKDVAYGELVMILDYMYHGEVSLPAEQIQRFLDVANRFKVRGLDETDSANSSSTQAPPSKPIQVQEKERSRRPSQAMKSVGLLCPQCNLMCRDVEILKCHIAEFHSKKRERSNPSSFACNVCDNIFGDSVNLEMHMRTMHDTATAPRPVGSVAPSIVRPPSRTSNVPVPHKTQKQGRPRTPHEKSPSSHHAPPAPVPTPPAPVPAAPVPAPAALHQNMHQSQGKRRRRDDVATTLSQRLGAGVSISTVAPEQQQQQEVKEEPQDEEEQEEVYCEEEEDKYAESQEEFMQEEEENYGGVEEEYQEEEEDGYPGYDYYGQA